MLKVQAAFSGFSVDDLQKAKEFYAGILGLKSVNETMGLRLALLGVGKFLSMRRPIMWRRSLRF